MTQKEEPAERLSKLIQATRLQADQCYGRHSSVVVWGLVFVFPLRLTAELLPLARLVQFTQPRGRNVYPSTATRVHGTGLLVTMALMAVAATAR